VYCSGAKAKAGLNDCQRDHDGRDGLVAHVGSETNVGVLKCVVK